MSDWSVVSGLPLKDVSDVTPRYPLMERMRWANPVKPEHHPPLVCCISPFCRGPSVPMCIHMCLHAAFPHSQSRCCVFGVAQISLYHRKVSRGARYVLCLILHLTMPLCSWADFNPCVFVYLYHACMCVLSALVCISGAASIRQVETRYKQQSVMMSRQHGNWWV